ncbi:helix-turn-helix domain-containing protein [Mycobacterium sp. ZZG]
MSAGGQFLLAATGHFHVRRWAVFHVRRQLHHVRAELIAHSPPSVTVTMVAGRWGFLHLGRFAIQYRQLFGESPSQTLRSSAQPPRPVPSS